MWPNPPAQNAANKKGNTGDKTAPSGSNTSNTNTSGTPKPPSDLASKLGADGRLTQEERQCHMDQNLSVLRQTWSHGQGLQQSGHHKGSCSLHHPGLVRLCCDGLKKLGSNPPAPVPDQGCIDLVGATVELRLNTSTLSSPNSLTIPLISDLIPSVTLITLVDSSSTHCFIEIGRAHV